MRIALWNIDPFTGSDRLLGELGWSVQTASPSACGRLLLEGDVDVALVPSIEVLGHTDAFSVLPNVAFATRRGFSEVTLEISKPLTDIRTVLCTADSEPFYGIASMVLREQYECSTVLVREGDSDAILHLGSPSAPDEPRHLDLGQEWFEMTATPLSWGFFAARPGTSPNKEMVMLQEALVSIIRGDARGVPAKGSDPDLSSAYCTMFDPDVSEGVDELAHYLFYMGILEDIPAVRLIAGQN